MQITESRGKLFVISKKYNRILVVEIISTMLYHARMQKAQKKDCSQQEFIFELKILIDTLKINR